jgi:hypothetical protein
MDQLAGRIETLGRHPGQLARFVPATGAQHHRFDASGASKRKVAQAIGIATTGCGGRPQAAILRLKPTFEKSQG